MTKQLTLFDYASVSADEAERIRKAEEKAKRSASALKIYEKYYSERAGKKRSKC